jgi:hypothetical protein
MKVYAVDRPDAPPIEMPERFRRDIAYFMAAPNEGGVPDLSPGEYWIRTEDARRWLDELVFEIISPLDSQNVAEVEITDDQEAFFEWLLAHNVNRVRCE